KVMTKKERILKKISNDKEVMRNINNNSYYTIERFYEDVKRYIKAIKEGRMINNISHVSSSGSSRDMKFLSCERNKYDNGFHYQNYYTLFLTLDYSESKRDRGSFKIYGGGMDMVFSLNYNNIHKFRSLGF